MFKGNDIVFPLHHPIINRSISIWKRYNITLKKSGTIFNRVPLALCRLQHFKDLSPRLARRRYNYVEAIPPRPWITGCKFQNGLSCMWHSSLGTGCVRRRNPGHKTAEPSIDKKMLYRISQKTIVTGFPFGKISSINLLEIRKISRHPRYATDRSFLRYPDKTGDAGADPFHSCHPWINFLHVYSRW